MAINYNPTKWENGKTILKASHFEKIEKGITDIINYNNSIYADEDIRKENEIKREEEHNKKIREVNTLVDDLKSDYDSLEKIIIDENASANLQNQINNVNSQLAQKASISSLNSKVWNMANMGQDVKEAITGGSVAVVGKNSILTENIVDGQITRNKTNFYTIYEKGNLIDRNAITKGKYIDNNGAEKSGNNETDFIFIDKSKTYKFNFISFVTFWDETKTYISGYIQGNNVTVNLVNVPENAKYVRLSVGDGALETCVFAESSYFTTSLETKFMDDNLLIKKEQITNFEVIGKDIKGNIARNSLDYYSLSSHSNLFEVTKVIEGGYYSNTGSWVKSNNTFSTDLIEIDPSKSYTHNIYSFISFWDKNEDFISGYIQGSMSVTNSINLNNMPENAKYVRFSVRIEDIPYIVVSESDVFSFELTNKYEDKNLIVKEENLDIALVQKLNSSSKNIAGKTINFLGDSITYGFDGTDSTRVSKPYPTIVGEILGATVNNYGISGSTIGGDGVTSTEHNVLGNTPMNIRYDNMSEADYVLVFGGVNDYTVDRRIPLGQKGDATNLTFYGSLKILIDGLIAKYPNSRIGFITPLRKINDHNPNVYGNYLKEYRNAIIEMCEEYSIPTLDLYTKGGCYANNSNWRAQNLPDGLHPNQAFYEKIAQQISSFIESI